MTPPTLDFATLRAQTLGIDTPLATPFGERLMVYADFTASGRCLRFVEDYLADLARLYANSHTEDDTTGRVTTHLLHEAEAVLKAAVNAGPSGRIIACGTGSTGAIDKLQQILGITLPPATRRRVGGLLREHFGPEAVTAFSETLREHQPVVFVGPYEHHSNEVTWREGLATVVETRLAADGGVDLGHLEELLRDERWTDRPRIGSFSAASNVTGMRTPVHEVARLLHRYDALACFDFAASAPYVEIDMNPEGDAEGALDAVFLSPHKYLGGPGASGVLVFNERIYPHDLAPSVGGGGTVDYVGPTSHDFTADVEAREKAGTPGVLQILRAALAVQVKHAVGVERIEAREQELLRRAFARWGALDAVELLGNPDPARRVGIVSFNLRCSNGQYLHPKLVTTLLNDVFGIQSRAGCSCAGPYGHRLLGIDDATSEKYRAWVRKGYHGIKPGWCRVGFHYAMDDAEADFIIDAVAFLAREGERFLPLYDFDLDSGVWVHRDADETMPSLSITDALDAPKRPDSPLSKEQRAVRYAETLAEAEAWAARLDARASSFALDGELGELQFFTLPAEA
ncbi:MAG: aminotransferase class V-fold PLP-dependent enzyme [Rhodothermales bacterium]